MKKKFPFFLKNIMLLFYIKNNSTLILAKPPVYEARTIPVTAKSLSIVKTVDGVNKLWTNADQLNIKCHLVSVSNDPGFVFVNEYAGAIVKLTDNGDILSKSTNPGDVHLVKADMPLVPHVTADDQGDKNRTAAARLEIGRFRLV